VSATIADLQPTVALQHADVQPMIADSLGRAAGLLGRRRLLLAGLAVFTAASLAGGLATSDTFLIVMRGIQGLGSALVLPAALSTVMNMFSEGAERNKALGIWGGAGALGGTVGLLADGILTTYVGWQHIFFFNVPIGAAALALAPAVVIGALSGVAKRDCGVASGLLSTSQNLGGTIGVAIASSIAASRFHTLVHHGYATIAALSGGLQWAVWACGATGLAAIPVAFVLIRRTRQAEVIATTQTQEHVMAASCLRVRRPHGGRRQITHGG
jgi:Major Facilitator Superfamily